MVGYLNLTINTEMATAIRSLLLLLYKLDTSLALSSTKIYGVGREISGNDRILAVASKYPFQHHQYFFASQASNLNHGSMRCILFTLESGLLSYSGKVIKARGLIILCKSFYFPTMAGHSACQSWFISSPIPAQ